MTAYETELAQRAMWKERRALTAEVPAKHGLGLDRGSKAHTFIRGACNDVYLYQGRF